MRRSPTEVVALGITLTIVAISVFLIVVGSQYSGVTVTRNCTTTGQCVDTQRFSSYFVPEPMALVPLLFGVAVAIGLIRRSVILAWSGTILLVAFSLLTGFSIGLFYLPFGLALAVIVSIIRYQKRAL